MNISYSDAGLWPGTGNINADPLFVGDGDYHLLPGSPCIDSGTSDTAPTTDIESNLRYDDPNISNTGGGQYPYYDIGAYEFQGGDYTPHAILGTVSGDVQAGVTISLSGRSSGSTTTDSSGNYSFTSLSNGEYTVTPGMDVYIFIPQSKQVIIHGADETGVDFSAKKLFSISGIITTGWKKAALPDVAVLLSGDDSAQETLTDNNGNYAFSYVPNGFSGRILPSKSGYRFIPRDRNVTVDGADVTNQNFRGRPPLIP
jgi:hypothetical protein